MRFISIIGYSLILSFISLIPGWSQELLTTAGDVFSNASIQMEWSAGEMIIETLTNEEIYLTQGFHQPVTVNDIKVNDHIRVYPNPFDLDLIIEFQELESENMYAQLCDISGKIICIFYNLVLYNDIPTADIPDGIYLLRIFDSHSNLLKTVKLIKLYQL